MLVTTKIGIDLQRPSYPAVINAVQGDQNTRQLEISLYSGSVAWQVPETATVAMRYCKPDKTKGHYDTMPDGSSAFMVSDNTVSILLAPQMLTVPGTVTAQVVLLHGTKILSTFCIQVRVEADPSAGVMESEDYINWLQWIEEELDAYLEQLKVNGEFVGGTVVGDVNMDGHRLHGLNDPTSDSDAATKKYVDPFDWRYKGTAIPASSTNTIDLDTYKTPGKYYITSGSLTQYLQNCPVSNDNFAMYVFVRTNDVDALQQVIFTLGGLIYARGADTSGTWRSWKSGVSEETIKTLITSALEEAKASGDFKGEDGDTPVKGVDYWTAADQESIVQQVIDALGTPVFGTVNSSNDIILSGSLAEGTYTVKYEDGSGKLTTIGTLTSSGSSGGDDPGDDGSDPVEITWSNRVKLDKDTGAETTADYYAASQHIPYDPDYTYTFTVSDNALMSASACWYGSSMNYLSWNTLTNAGSGGAESGVAEPVSDAAYMRIRLYINVLPTDSEYASLLNGITLTKKKK